MKDDICNWEYKDQSRTRKIRNKDYFIEKMTSDQRLEEGQSWRNLGGESSMLNKAATANILRKFKISPSVCIRFSCSSGPWYILELISHRIHYYSQGLSEKEGVQHRYRWKHITGSLSSASTLLGSLSAFFSCLNLCILSFRSIFAIEGLSCNFVLVKLQLCYCTYHGFIFKMFQLS